MRWIAAMAATLLVVRPCATGAESPLVEVRTVVEQWVQTRQLISRTQADWEAEKEMLVQTKALYERELAGIETQMSKVSTNSVQVDREREAAEKDLKESVETLDHATGVMAGLEARVRAMTGRLPSPLVETMQPLLARLPEEQRSLVEGYYYRREEISRLAGQSGRTVTATYKALQRIRLALQTCIERAAEAGRATP